MGAFSLVFTGCKKESETSAPPVAPAPAVDPSSPQSYMNDKPFIDKLKKQKNARATVTARHMEVRRAYEAALKDDPKGEKPETQELKRQLDALGKEYLALRQETMKTVRDRIAPKKGN